MLNDEIILKHYIKYFKQEPLFSMKFGFKEVDVKIYVFYPSKEYDFYKLVTSGCSYLLDIKSEYMMFLSKNAPVQKGSDDDRFIFYPLFLLKSSLIGYDQGVDISYYDVANLKEEQAYGVMYLPPQVIKDKNILSLQKEDEHINFLQVVPLSKRQYEYALNHSLVEFAEIFYKHDKKDKVISCNPFADEYLKRDELPLFNKK